MNSSDWPLLEDLFHRAAELPAAELPAFLQSACPEAGLRAELESLLAHDGTPGSLEETVQLEAVSMATAGDEWAGGRHIGPYRIEELIGEGGMGAVYLAVRDDDQYHKKVAIKIVQRGMETRELLERFRAERQILASLEHPNIARLLDGGATADGIPYFVMELIDGLPITRYAEEKGLTIEARLRLFLKVCEAVQYAHASLTVHRDLKPANILITGDGTPKLLDFGLAKILSTDRDPAEASRTGSLMILTPDYASPEQVLGAAVTTATDVYSLGGVLYSLLTGHGPHQLANRTPVEIERAICAAEPVPPSQCAKSGLLPPRKLAGDLDNIVMKALRKEPLRRYRSVEQFAQDIARYLEGRPIEARPSTVWYRSARFVRRNRLVLGATAAVFVALAVGATVSTIQARHAERRFQQVRKLAHTVLFDLHDRIRDLSGATLARQTIVTTGLEYLSNLSGEARGDAALEAELGEAYVRLGDVQGDPLGNSLGDTKGALDSYQRAVALYRSAARRSTDPAVPPALARALNHLGSRQNASGDRAAARASHEEAMQILDSVLARDPSNAGALAEFTSSAGMLSRLLVTEGDYDAAVALSSRRLQLSLRLLEADPQNPQRRFSAASAYAEYGVDLSRQGGAAEKVLAAYREAVRIRDSLVQEFPQDVRYRRTLMIDLSHLGDTLGSQDFVSVGDVAGARVQFVRMLEIAEGLAAADSANRTARMDLAQAHLRMGAIELAGERLDDSLRELRSAYEITLRLLTADPSTIALRINRSYLETKIGTVLAAQGNLPEGIAWLQKGVALAREIAESQPGVSNYYVSMLAYICDLAPALGRAHDRAALDRLSAESAMVIDRLRSVNLSPLPACRPPRTYMALGEGYQAAGDRSEACRYFAKSVAAWQEVEKGKGVPVQFRPLQAAAMQEYAVCEKQ